MQNTTFTDANPFQMNLKVKAEKFKINIPVFENYNSKLYECILSPNGQFAAITLSLYPINKSRQGYINVQLYNVINGEELFAKLWDSQGSLITVKFSSDSSLFIVLEMENLIVIDTNEKNIKSIIKINSHRLLSIDSDNNISIISSDKNITIYSFQSGLIKQLSFDIDLEYLQLLGKDYAIYNYGQYGYIINILNKKVMQGWKNQEQEIIDQIIYNKFLSIQLYGYNIKQIYIRLLKSGKIIRIYQNQKSSQVQNRVAYENSSIKIYNFQQIRIKKPIQNPTKQAFQIELYVNKIDLLRGEFNKYEFKLNEDYNRLKELPIYILKDNLLKYYLFSE